MPVLIGELEKITGSPSSVTQVMVRAHKTRITGSALTTDELVPIPVDRQGRFEVPLRPGKAVLVLVHGGRVGEGERFPMLVEEGLGTIASAIKLASDRFDDYELDELERAAADMLASLDKSLVAATRAEVAQEGAQKDKDDAEKASTAAQEAAGTAAEDAATEAVQKVDEKMSGHVTAAKGHAEDAGGSATSAKQDAGRAESARERTETIERNLPTKISQELEEKVPPEVAKALAKDRAVADAAAAAVEPLAQGAVDAAAEEIKWDRGDIFGGTDLNEITTPGAYYATNSAAETTSNAPFGVNGFALEVLAGPGRTIIQRATESRGLTVEITTAYRWTFDGSDWSDWKRYLTENDAEALGWQRSALGTTHLDTVMAHGAYGQGSSSTATSERGYPIRAAGYLEVSRIGSNQYLQAYFSDQGAFTRRFVGGAWSEWKSVLDQTSVYRLIDQRLTLPEVRDPLIWQKSTLGQNTHLDTVQTPGLYGQGTTSWATADNGYPIKLAGMLEVGLIGVGQYIQAYITDQAAFSRRLVNGSWSQWTMLGGGSGVDREAVLDILSEPEVQANFEGAPGPEGRQGAPGPQGAPGIPGVDAVPASEAVAAYAETEGSPLHETLHTMFEEKAPERGVERRIYVRETGRSDGDGSWHAPFRQISEAISTLESDGPVIRGSVVIDVGPGDYDGDLRLPLTRNAAQDDFVKIIGRVDTNGVPTSRVVSTSRTGLMVEDGTAVWIENMKFVGAFSTAIRINRDLYAWFKNVHIDGEGVGAKGISLLAHARYAVAGGIIENCTYAGIEEYFLVNRNFATVSSSAEQMLIRNCGIGLRAKELCTGHLDYLQVEDCGTGVELIQNSVANIKGMEFRRNQTGLSLVNSISHNEGAVVWGQGVDANDREVYSVGMSGELRAMMWTGENMARESSVGHRPLMLIANNYQQATVAGDLDTEVSLAMFDQVLARPFFRTVGKHFRVTALVNCSGASEATPVQINLRVGSILAGYVDVCEEGDVEVLFDSVCIQDQGDHMVHSSLPGARVPNRVVRRTQLMGGDPSGVMSVEVSAIPRAEGQSVDVQAVEMWG